MSNLFRKVTASVAATAVVFSVIAPVAGVSANTVASDAATRLAALGVIEPQVSEAGYKLDSTITRREMLKVMINLSPVEATEGCVGSFADLKATDWGCKYAEAALRAGYIAANTNFRPDADVTEAEALKMILQARGIEKAAGVEPWETAYLEAAIEAGVVAAGTKLSAGAAKRSFVFVSADSAVTNASIEDDEDDFDFNLDDLLNGNWDDEDETDEDNTSTDGNTSNDGSTVVVTGGDVEVSLNPASPSNGTQIPSSGSIRFAKVDFTAGDKDVSINVVELSSVGLAAVDNSTRVWFEKNGKRLSGQAAFSSDRTAVVSFAPAYVIKAGTTETLDLYVRLASNVAGNDFQFSGKITQSSAANNRGSFVTSALRTALYTVAPVTFNVTGAGITSNQSADAVELGRFTVRNEDQSSETRDVLLQSVSLRNIGNADLLDLADLHIERNGVKVSTEVSTNGKDATFVLNDTVKDASTAIYYIKAKVVNVQNQGGDTYQFSLRNDTDLSAVEVLNGFRSTVTRTVTDLSTYTVRGSDIKFERDTSVALSQNYAKGTDNVVLLQGTITTKSPITLEDLKLGYTYENVANSGANQLFDTVYVQIGSSVMTWTANAAGQAEFLGLATVSGSAQVKIYAKLKDGAPASNFRFNDVSLASFDKKEYVTNQNNVQNTASIGAISAVQVSVDSTGLSITRVDGLGDTKVAVGSRDVLANRLNLVVNQGNEVQISNAEYTITGSGTYLNNATATLYVNGVVRSTRQINSNTVVFDGLSQNVGKTALSLEVRVDFQDAYNAGEFSIKLTDLDIVDTLTSQTVTLPTVPSSAKFTVADAKGIVSVSDNNPKASLLLAGDKDQKVLAFRVKAENDAVKLRDLVFTGTNLDNLSNFRVLTPTNKYIAATSTTNTEVKFSNVNPEDSIVMDRTETFYLVADINTNVNATFTVSLDVAQTQVRASNGRVVLATGNSVASNLHLVAENKAVVAKSSNASKNLTTSALRFSVTASGKDNVVLSGATFSNLFSGYETATGKIVVYKDSISSNNKLGETALGTTTGNVVFTAQNTVDAGSTNNYIVVLEGVVAQSGANTLDWQVSLSNLEVVSGNVTINANAYNNMGEFPITETR